MVYYAGSKAVIGTIAAGVAGVTTGYVVGRATSHGSNSKNSRRKRNKGSNRKNSTYKSQKKKRKLKFGSPAYRKKYLGKRKKQKQPYTAGKNKDTSRRRIRYTKRNQPYIITATGKARFIKKNSVSSSRKRKGGKY